MKSLSNRTNVGNGNSGDRSGGDRSGGYVNGGYVNGGYVKLIGKIRIVFYLVILSVFFLIWRYPSFSINSPLNVDESVMMAGVQRVYAYGWIPWRDFDTTTIGPITIWFLASVGLVIGTLSYEKMHILASLLFLSSIIISLLLSFYFSQSCGQSWRAFFAAYAIAIGIILLSNIPDYLHFSSYLIPLLFITTAAGCMGMALKKASQWQDPLVWLCLGGFLAGISVLAKMQSLPIALYLVLVAPYLMAKSVGGRSSTAFSSWMGLLIMSLGSFGVPWLILVTILEYDGDLRVGFISYILSNISYGFSNGGGSLPPNHSMPALGYCFWDGWWIFGGFIPLVVIAIILFYLTKYFELGLGSKWKLLGFRSWKFLDSFLNKDSSVWGYRARNRARKLALPMALDRVYFYFLLGWLVVSFIAIGIPYHKLLHHGGYLISPMIVFLSYVISQIKPPKVSSLFGWKVFGSNGFILTLLLFLWLGLVAPKLTMNFRFYGVDWGDYNSGSNQGERSLQELNLFVEKTTKPEDSIVVWGWVPEVYVSTTRVSGSRHIISHFLIDSGSGRDVLLDGFIQDIKKNKPVLFIDALSPGFHLWWLGYGYEEKRAQDIFEIQQVLEEYYEKIAVLDSGAMVYQRVR